MMVLIFEGIVTGVLNFDYSSCAEVIGDLTTVFFRMSECILRKLHPFAYYRSN